jgi:hypothetical protein
MHQAADFTCPLSGRYQGKPDMVRRANSVEIDPFETLAAPQDNTPDAGFKAYRYSL